MDARVRELALFNLGIDSKLRGCDLVALKVRDVCHGEQVATRAIVVQHKTQRPVQVEITQASRDALQAWIKLAGLKPEDFLFPSRLHDSPHLGTRQYPRILAHWVEELGLDRAEYGTHSMRRTKATLICRRTKNLRAVQLLLGHSKLESTVRYSESRSMTLWPKKLPERRKTALMPPEGGLTTCRRYSDHNGVVIGIARWFARIAKPWDLDYDARFSKRVADPDLLMAVAREDRLERSVPKAHCVLNTFVLKAYASEQTPNHVFGIAFRARQLDHRLSDRLGHPSHRFRVFERCTEVGYKVDLR
jgi:hypothetical protein